MVVLLPMIFLLVFACIPMVLAAFLQLATYGSAPSLTSDGVTYAYCDPTAVTNEGGYDVTDGSGNFIETIPNKCNTVYAYTIFAYDLWGVIIRQVFPANEYTTGGATIKCAPNDFNCSNFETAFWIQVMGNLIVGGVGIAICAWAIDLYRKNHHRKGDWGKIWFLAPRNPVFHQWFEDTSVVVKDSFNRPVRTSDLGIVL